MLHSNPGVFFVNFVSCSFQHYMTNAEKPFPVTGGIITHDQPTLSVIGRPVEGRYGINYCYKVLYQVMFKEVLNISKEYNFKCGLFYITPIDGLVQIPRIKDYSTYIQQIKAPAPKLILRFVKDIGLEGY